MDRAEIVDCEPNGEAVFLAIIYKIAFWVKMAKMTVDEIKQAGIQCNINKPSICLENCMAFVQNINFLLLTLIPNYLHELTYKIMGRPSHY